MEWLARARLAAGFTTLIVCGWTGETAWGAELQQHTLEAFERYTRLTEARLEGDLNPFLWVDTQPEPRRQELHTQLLRGDTLVERLQTYDAGRTIECPDGMIHHWIATAFVPDVTLAEVLALVQDYDSYDRIYHPDIEQSSLLHRNGDRFQVSLRLYKKSLVTVVLNTRSEVEFIRVSDQRARSRSHSIRIAQVENAGTPDERERPVGNDSGFLWRLNNYWRFEARDGGVYLQTEAIALTRDIPWVFRWLVRPLVSRIPRETLRSLLTATRRALVEREE